MVRSRALWWATFVVSLSSCPGPVGPSTCEPSTCTGCCTMDGRCEPGDDTLACGARASACAVCSGAETCVGGRCSRLGAGGGSAGGGDAGGGAGTTGGGSAGGGDAGGGAGTTGGGSTGGGAAGGGGVAGGSAQPQPEWVLDPGLTANELGVLVNEADPISVAVAARYVTARSIPVRNVVRLTFDAGTSTTLSAQAFAPLKAIADAQGEDAGVQAWVVTWTRPYRVDCMSLGTAFAVGFDAGFCSTPCAPTTGLSTFDDEGLTDAGPSHRFFDRLRIRPTMMLASNGADAGVAFSTIAQGLAADDSFPSGEGFFVRTTDMARSVRWPEWVSVTMPQWADGGLTLSYVDGSMGGPQALVDAGPVLFYFQSSASVPSIATNQYLPGAVADHLTSFGGQVPTSGQMSQLRWLEAGATASYGTVVEPCNFTTKFPNTTVLLSHYFRGEPIIEAYWKSVRMPGEGLFTGEPLARPWGAQLTTWDATSRTLGLTTTHLKPGLRYAIDSAPTRQGPWTRVRLNVSVPRHGRTTITVPGATEPFYRLVRY
ncbi:MAG: TIGR03790 family protein [Myxococcaceae bacterium]|nr:TIGR03790 family protein [Myxococcaceae bacterium]